MKTFERLELRDMFGVEVAHGMQLRLNGDGDEVAVGSFGDLLGLSVVELVLAGAGRSGAAGARGARRLLGAGSRLGLASSGSTVWGAGVARSDLGDGEHAADLDIRAVRGPWSAAELASRGQSVPETYGDPILLLGRLLPEVPRVPGSAGLKIFSYGVEDADTAELLEQAAASGFVTLGPSTPHWQMLSAIAHAQFVVGSSVPAIAVADAYGVPARFVGSADDGVDFELLDYLIGSGRPRTVIADDVDSAVALGGHEPPSLDLNELHAAFPWDLWTATAQPRPTSRSFSPSEVAVDLWRSRVSGGADVVELSRQFSDLAVGALDARDPSIATAQTLRDVRSLVLPDLRRPELTERVRDLVLAIDGNADVAALAAMVGAGGPTESARVLAWRELGDTSLVTLEVSLIRAVGSTTEAVLEVGGTSVVTEPVLLFAVNHGQTVLELNILLTRGGLGPADEVLLRILDEHGERVIPVAAVAPSRDNEERMVNA